jgi:hypothetical protein
VEKQLAGLAFNELRSYFKEKLGGTQFFSLVHLHQRALTCESRSKETLKPANHKMYLVGRDGSDDESTNVYTTNLFSQHRLDLRHVHLYSWCKRTNKKLSLLLLLLNVTKYSMSY